MSATGTAASGEGAAAHVKEAETLFQTLRAAKECHSLLHKHLTQAVFDKIKDKKTALGGTLVNCMRSGVENINSHIGVYASDPEAYKTFQELFDAVIKDYHKLPEKRPVTHPASEFGDLEKIKLDNPDPEGKFVLSTRIRVGRSQENYEFCPIVSKEKRLELENNAKAAFEGFGDELKGTYHPLTGMTDETKKQLTEDHFLFNDTDNYLLVAGGYNDWPSGRGIFFNHDKTFLVWVNEEDHLRIISMQPGADIGAVYKRLINGINAMGEKLKFVRDDRLGFVTFCPTNLGTSLRASVHIKIPHLAASDKFKATCDKLNLQARGIHGENSESEGGVYDISNKRRLGLTEIQAVQEMYNGVKEIIRLEKELAW